MRACGIVAVAFGLPPTDYVGRGGHAVCLRRRKTFARAAGGVNDLNFVGRKGAVVNAYFINRAEKTVVQIVAARANLGDGGKGEAGIVGRRGISRAFDVEDNCA